jgi:hypothetical protein
MRTWKRKLRRSIGVSAASLLSIFLLVSVPTAISQTDKPMFGDPGLPSPSAAPPVPTPKGPPSAFVQSRTVYKLSLRIKLAIAGAILTVGLVAFAFSVRAWRSGNLFNRQYHFPPVATVALRLGANKSGGCMATIVFSDAPDSASEDS